MKKILLLLATTMFASSASAQGLELTGLLTGIASGEEMSLSGAANRGGATPCIRTVASDASLHQISGSFNGVFTEAGPALHGEPLHVELLTLDFESPDIEAFHKAMGTKVDYLFRAKITSDKKKSNFTATVDLVDVPRNIVVKTQTASWSTSHDLSTEIKAGKELGQGFMPLKELLYEYEKIPLKGEVNVPGDEVGSGEKVTISVEKLRFNNELPKSWQFIAIKVEKGKILNGEFLEGYYYFRIGKGDFVDIEYQAPEGCKDQTEHLDVYNSCIFYWEGDNRSFSSLQKDIIASKEFPIVCYDGELVSDVEGVIPDAQLTVHISKRLPFKRVDGNRVIGKGVSPGELSAYTPRLQSAGQVFSINKFEGTILTDNTNKKNLDYKYLEIEMIITQKMQMKDAHVNLKIVKSFEKQTEFHRRHSFHADGGWSIFEYKINNNELYDGWGYGCSNDGDCEVLKWSTKKLGPMMMMTVCASSGGAVMCQDTPIIVSELGKGEPVYGKIEWKNGAEVPINYSSAGVTLKGKVKLILYKK